jgi:thioredoxin-like negative regulator of GroEL
MAQQAQQAQAQQAQAQQAQAQQTQAQQTQAQQTQAQQTQAQQTQIITAMTPLDLQYLQKNARGKVVVVKFGATWCNPCKVIKPTCEAWIRAAPANIIYADIDIDESMDLYMALKNKKMVRGVPVLLAFDCSKQRDQWYIPDDSVEGGDSEAVEKFFQRVSVSKP